MPFPTIQKDRFSQPIPAQPGYTKFQRPDGTWARMRNTVLLDATLTATDDDTNQATVLSVVGGGGSGITQLTGDVTAGPGSGSQAATLATVATAGTTGDATHVAAPTINAKGLVTSVASVAISVPATAISDSTATGRAVVTAANAAAARTAIGAGTGNGDALTTNPLSQFAATTSAQLAGVLSDETGSGAAVFATSPTLVTPVLGAASATSLTLSTPLAVAQGGTGTTTAVLVAETLGSEIPTAGSNLGDTSPTLTIAGGAQYVLPGATLTANRTVTLGTGGSPITGEEIAILRRDATAFTLLVQDDASTALITLPASTRFAAYFRYSGTHWTLAGAIRIQ